MRTQCVRAESLLADDFRVLAFLKADVPDSKGKVLEEEVRAMPGVAEARFVSRGAALRALGEQDPAMIQAVAVLGENPLPPAVEIRPRPEAAASSPAWIEAVSKLPEVADTRFKPMEFGALLQAQFYRRFLNLGISLAAFLWLLGAAAGLWSAAASAEARRPFDGIGLRFACAALGTLGGMCLVYAAACPFQSAGPWWAWPVPLGQSALLLAGSAGGCLIPEGLQPPRRRHARPLPEIFPERAAEDEPREPPPAPESLAREVRSAVP